MANLDAQIAQEAQELANAPTVQPGLLAGRCHWCGQFSADVVLVERIGDVERYKGVYCCGQRHL